GCDASVMIESTKYNKAEKDHPDNLSLSGDGFDAIVKAKQALDAVPNCRNKVSCADIITIATRDVVNIVGGPWYDVELGRLDGLSSTAASVGECYHNQPTMLTNSLHILPKTGLVLTICLLYPLRFCPLIETTSSWHTYYPTNNTKIVFKSLKWTI
ncbi:hypothetical protein Bca52824_095648, partial [Brassica carinata]